MTLQGYSSLVCGRITWNFKTPWWTFSKLPGPSAIKGIDPICTWLNHFICFGTRLQPPAHFNSIKCNKKVTSSADDLTFSGGTEVHTLHFSLTFHLLCFLASCCLPTVCICWLLLDAQRTRWGFLHYYQPALSPHKYLYTPCYCQCLFNANLLFYSVPL